MRAEYRVGLVVCFTAEPGEHADEEKHMRRIEKDMRRFYKKLELKYGYSTKHPVPFKALVERV